MTTAFTHTPTGPRIAIEPDEALIDQPVRVRLFGFAPQQPVTLRASMTDELGRRWESYATFLPDDQGVVDVASQAPLAGTYTDSDPMGLFWSMSRPPGDEYGPSFVNMALQPTVMTVTAEVESRQVASASLTRLFVAPGVTQEPVQEHGLAGTLFRPADPGPHPGLIVLGGSAGGMRWSQNVAPLLASHGYASLALAYFAFEHLPAALANIPLEYFETAMEWLQAQPGIIADWLGVAGVSRGGELALLLGATFPQVKAVVAYAPSHVVFGSVGVEGEPGWTYRGVALAPMHSQAMRDRKAEIFSQEPIVLTRLFLIGLADAAAIQDAAIPVDKIQAPVLLISGQDDQMWPSALMAEMVRGRLAEHSHPYPVTHLSYPGCGHIIPLPYLPTTVLASRHPVANKVFALGGTARDTAYASRHSWAEVLKFLNQSLRLP